jgi:UDP-GlcNAc:undecaprenyl-phosphate GlcNAc-1-phosphate transferase
VSWQASCGERIVVAGVGALVVALLLTPAARWLMGRLGAWDLPGGRHVHDKPTPRGAGWVMVLGFLFGLWLALTPFSGPLLGMVLGLAVLVPLCLLDDVWRVPPLPRLLGQVLAASLAWRFGVRIEGISNPAAALLGPPYLALGWISWPATVLWLVLMTNAVNWLDGIDGLAAGVTAIAAAALAYMAYLAGMTEVACAAAALAGGALGFLRYNFSPASVFMGDAGSMALGFLLASVATVGAFKTTAAGALAGALLVSGVPLYDALSTMWGRWRRGQPLHVPDRTHVHHRLLARGLTTVQAVLLLYGATAILCLLAITIWRT